MEAHGAHVLNFPNELFFKFFQFFMKPWIKFAILFFNGQNIKNMFRVKFFQLEFHWKIVVEGIVEEFGGLSDKV